MEVECFIYILLLLSTIFQIDMCRPTNHKQNLDPNEVLNGTYSSNDAEFNSSLTQSNHIPLLGSVLKTENSTVLRETQENKLELNKTESHGSGISQTSETHKHADQPKPPKKELPMGMIIAGPAAILGIILFLCFTYYCHASQLKREAKTYSIALYVSMDESTDSTTDLIIPAVINAGRAQSPATLGPPMLQRENSGRLQRENSGRLQRENSDSRRKPSTLAVPAIHHKRGSSWSSLGDQEAFSLPVPRRHSSFIL